MLCRPHLKSDYAVIGSLDPSASIRDETKGALCLNTWCKTCLSWAITATVSLGLLWGGDRLTEKRLADQSDDQVRRLFAELADAAQLEELNVHENSTVVEAWKALDTDQRVLGYAVTTSVQGFGGSIEIHVTVAADGQTVQKLRIGEHHETEGYGARVEEAAFTDQFASQRSPFYLAGSTRRTALRNGTYRAADDAYDYAGFRDVVTLTVSDGKITKVDWDAEQKNGQSTKKALSKAGRYTMSDTGLPWHQQAEIMENALLSLQDPTRISYNSSTGKADAHTGATISVSPFVRLATEALNMAKSTEGSAIDGISGATISSQAVIRAVNEAANFIASLT